jgi:hypothetical protein
MKNNKLQLSICSKKDLTDKSLLNFLQSNKNFIPEEYTDFLSTRNLNSELAIKILSFLVAYDSGFLKPDKCNAYEPIKEDFNENNLTDPIRWLSQPGGAFYFKKIKGLKLEGIIENHRFAPIWEEGELMKPKVSEPLYLTEVKFFFDEQTLKQKGLYYWIDLLENLSKTIDSNFGVLTTEKNFERETIPFSVDANKVLSDIYWLKYFDSR